MRGSIFNLLLTGLFLLRDTDEDSITNLTKLLDSMEGKRHLKLIRPMSGGKSKDKLFIITSTIVLFTVRSRSLCNVFTLIFLFIKILNTVSR